MHNAKWWALAAVGGILYLATRAASSSSASSSAQPQPPAPLPPTTALLPLTAAGPPVATWPLGEPSALDYRQSQYTADFRQTVIALESRTESGRVLELEGPVL